MGVMFDFFRPNRADYASRWHGLFDSFPGFLEVEDCMTAPMVPLWRQETLLQVGGLELAALQLGCYVWKHETLDSHSLGKVHTLMPNGVKVLSLGLYLEAEGEDFSRDTSEAIPAPLRDIGSC